MPFRGILLILFEVGFALKFNLVGEISISELFLVFYSPFFLQRFIKSKNTSIRFLLFVYIFLLVSQILSESVVSNNMANSLKGIAITIVSFLHLSFLILIFSKNISDINFILIGLVIKMLCFRTEDVAEDSFASLTAVNNDAKFLKFYLAPIITYVLLYLSTVFRKHIAPLLMLVSMGFIFLGARSMGLMLLLSTIMIYVLENKSRFNMRLALWCILGGVIFVYTLYVLYVNSVLKGEITAGNSSQILMLDNPYNPFELLLYGRHDFYGSWIAFKDSPIFGYGAWSKDITGYYNFLMAKWVHLDIPQYMLIGKGMPMHSVILGYGVMNGILSLISVSCLIFFVIRKGFYALKSLSAYSYIISYFIIALLWNGLFSPLSHFRLYLPLYMSFIFISYFKQKKDEKAKNYCGDRL